MELLKPKEVTIVDIDGIERTYTISRIPFMDAREIGFQYIPSALPKVGDYKVNRDMMQKIMGYVAVDANGQKLRLTTSGLIDNHIPDVRTGLALEGHMMNYNAGFFYEGTTSDFFDGVVQKLITKILETLTRSQGPSSPRERPASMNSGPSTI